MKHEEILSLNKRVAAQLSAIYKGEEEIPLLFPFYQKKNQERQRRVSEQEARIVFCNLLFQKKIPFSVETPTNEKHSFSGGKEISARTDITLYDSARQKEVLHIELKAHNARQSSISKDFKKLTCEKIAGNWFHLFESQKKNTLPVLMEKFNKALSGLKFITPELLLCIFVLDTADFFYHCCRSNEKMPEISRWHNERVA